METYTRTIRTTRIGSWATPKRCFKLQRLLEKLGTNCSKRATSTARFRNIRVGVVVLEYDSEFHTVVRAESVRYLDTHQNLPENTPSGVREGYSALLAPLLLNSALAAIRIQPPNTNNAKYPSRTPDGVFSGRF